MYGNQAKQCKLIVDSIVTISRKSVVVKCELSACEPSVIIRHLNPSVIIGVFSQGQIAENKGRGCDTQRV